MRRSAPVVYVEAFEARYCEGRRTFISVGVGQCESGQGGKEKTHEVRRLEFLDVARPTEDRLLIQHIFDSLVRRTHRRVKEPARRAEEKVGQPAAGERNKTTTTLTRERWC